MALGRFQCVRAGHAGAGPGRLSPQGARRLLQGVDHLDGRVGDARAAVQRRRLALLRLPEGARVLHWLPHREVAERGQRLCLRAAVLLLRGAGNVSAQGAVLGHPRRAHHAGGHDRPRRGAHHQVHLDHLRFRRFPDPHRHQDGGEARGGNPSRAQPGGEMVQETHAGHERLPRRQVLRPREWRARRHALVCRSAVGGSLGPHLRGGFHTRHLRGHHGSVHRLYLERIRHSGSALPLFCPGRHHGQVPLPQDRPGRRPCLCRRQNAPRPHRLEARHPGLPGGGRGHSRHLRRGLAPPAGTPLEFLGAPTANPLAKGNHNPPAAKSAKLAPRI